MQRCVGDAAGVAMSYVVAVPEFVASAAADLTGIGEAVSAANAVAAAQACKPMLLVECAAD
jgi:hypothetical protein